ncbi:MAG: Sec-independent protein translocase subunit TatA [Pseudomonadota bacterium]
MGFGVTELIIILAIVLVLFGAKKLRNIGGDLGGAIKNFKSAMNEDENDKSITAKKSADSIENKSTDATFETTVEDKKKETV